MKRLLILILILIFFSVVPKANAGIYTTEKMITVDLGSQTLRGWKDGKIVYETKASTGMYLTPTVKGSFKIYLKFPLQDMKGPSPYRNIYPAGRYYIKNVPYVMYFYQGYAIHGNYWRGYFGSPGSHGCVGISPTDAQWLYSWADIGTRVEVF